MKAFLRRGGREPWRGGSPRGDRGFGWRKHPARANGFFEGSKALKAAASFGELNRHEGNGHGDVERLLGEGKPLKGGNPTGACSMKQGYEVLRGVNRQEAEKA